MEIQREKEEKKFKYSKEEKRGQIEGERAWMQMKLGEEYLVW